MFFWYKVSPKVSPVWHNLNTGEGRFIAFTRGLFIPEPSGADLLELTLSEEAWPVPPLHLQDGIDIRTMQGWIGHRDIASTVIYLKGVRSSSNNASTI